ncbi:MAG: hypothetical protein ABIA93_01470 [Candidatus Woesearchaeota archaeon]
MDSVKTIKGVDEEAWAEFKGFAKNAGIPMGKFFGKLVESHKKESETTAWEEILNKKPSLTEEEAELAMKRIKEFRKDPGWRKS